MIKGVGKMADRINEILRDIGVSGPAIEPTRKYAEEIIDSCPDITDQQLNITVGSFFDGFQAALK